MPTGSTSHRNPHGYRCHATQECPSRRRLTGPPARRLRTCAVLTPVCNDGSMTAHVRGSCRVASAERARRPDTQPQVLRHGPPLVGAVHHGSVQATLGDPRQA